MIMKDIDWSEAPEGATHHGQFGTHFQWYKVDGEVYSYEKQDKVFGITEWSIENVKNNDSGYCYFTAKPLIDFDADIPKEFDEPFAPQPAFTQAMADNGELPQVGSEVVARYNFDSKQVTHKGVVLYVSKHHVILNTIHGNEWHGLIGDYVIEPIDQRSDKEKAIDAIDRIITNAYQESTDSFISDSRFKSEAIHLFDEIIDGTVEGVKWVGDSIPHHQV